MAAQFLTQNIQYYYLLSMPFTNTRDEQGCKFQYLNVSLPFLFESQYHPIICVDRTHILGKWSVSNTLRMRVGYLEHPV